MRLRELRVLDRAPIFTAGCAVARSRTRRSRRRDLGVPRSGLARRPVVVSSDSSAVRSPSEMPDSRTGRWGVRVVRAGDRRVVC